MFLLLTLIKVLLHFIFLFGFFFLTPGPDRQPRLAVLPPAGLWGSLAVRCGPWYTSGFASMSLQSFLHEFAGIHVCSNTTVTEFQWVDALEGPLQYHSYCRLNFWRAPLLASGSCSDLICCGHPTTCQYRFLESSCSKP